MAIEQIGVYRIVRPLGQGGMGAVYEVVHEKLGVHYALKTFTLDHGHVDLLKERFLAEGRILAALDVTDPEPLPPDHPLWQTPNVHITPHISGFFHLPQTLDRIVSIAAQNLRRFCEGRPLLNVVDSETGYRREDNRA